MHREKHQIVSHTMLQSLTKWIHENGLAKQSFFHISDEPNIDHLESYGNASRMVREYFEDFPIIYALSDYDYDEKGLVKNPAPANDHMEPFLEHGVSPLWTYYCCVQYKAVSNRFFNMPSTLSGILGVRLYKYNVSGYFLRALQLLDEIFGREYVLAALEEGLERPISFHCYPIEDSWLLSKREWINRKIKEHFKENDVSVNNTILFGRES
ncbi:hypothetical protein QFZ77_006528 [Paenibacillus sp. V4I3]|uniref:glycoside hydrolase domain-containing protein n=1 Tax=Paenibacillus sp. V4I3 TaxID=3042305 RepID=UPI002780EB21|nr:glycoside hydrolase domain-containing protein [Paenibacillus sp. V4I3]MDQ0877869.1 hypothetical protein [Paenibacillus sp. V4I3]